MESTSEFVQKLNEDRKKQEKNKKRGKGHPDKQLPNNQHN
jgi:Protein of unknown function (DUF4023)